MAVRFKHVDSRAFNDRRRQKRLEPLELAHVDTCQSDTKQFVVCEEGMPIPKQLNPGRAMRFVIRHAGSVDCPNYSHTGTSAGDLTGRVTQEPPSDSDEYYSSDDIEHNTSSDSLDEHNISYEKYNLSPTSMKKLTKTRESSRGNGCKPCENEDSSSEDEYFVASAERPRKKKRRNRRSFSDYAYRSEELDTDIKTVTVKPLNDVEVVNRQNIVIRRLAMISNHVKHQVRVNEPDEMFNSGFSCAAVDSAVEHQRKNKRWVWPCAKRQDVAIFLHRQVDERVLGRLHQMVPQTSARKESEHSCKERNTGSFNNHEVEYLQTKKTKTSPLLTERQDIKVEWLKMSRVATVLSSIAHEPQRKHRMKPSDLIIGKVCSQFRERRELYLQKMRTIETEQLCESDFESRLMTNKTGRAQLSETASNQIEQRNTKSSATNGTKKATKHQEEVSQNRDDAPKRNDAPKREFRVENISYNQCSESTNHRPKHGPAKKCRQDDSEYQSISDAFEESQSSTLSHAQKRLEKIKILSKPQRIRRYRAKHSPKIFHRLSQDGKKCDGTCHLSASHHHLNTPEVIQPQNKNSRSFLNLTEAATNMQFRKVVWLSLLMGTAMEMAKSSFGMASAYHARMCKGIQAVEKYISGILENLEKMSKRERHQWMKKAMAYMASRIAGKSSGKQGCCRKRKWKRTTDESIKTMLKRRREEVQRNNQTTEDDERMIINEGYIQEQPEVQLMQPPTGKPSQPNYQDKSQRVNSFRGCQELRLRAHDLASSGLHLTSFNIVKCSSCQRQCHMRELDKDSSRWHFPTCHFRNARTSRHQGQTSHGLDVVAADAPGRVSDEIGDPPGQQSVYIPPGGTFEIGPGNAVIIQSGPDSRPNPAIHIGNETAPPPPRRWRMENVVSADHRRFLSNLYPNRELDRLTSFGRWPVSRPNVAPAALARTGFFYLGDMDRTQCFSCGGVLRNWTLEDDAQEEMRKKKLEIENVLKTSDVCKNVIAMGFSVNVVRRPIEEGIDAKNANPENVYTSTSALFDDVMKKEEEMQREAEEEARNQASLMSSMQSVLGEKTPKNSADNQAGTVYLCFSEKAERDNQAVPFNTDNQRHGHRNSSAYNESYFRLHELESYGFYYMGHGQMACRRCGKRHFLNVMEQPSRRVVWHHPMCPLAAARRPCRLCGRWQNAHPDEGICVSCGQPPYPRRAQ